MSPRTHPNDEPAPVCKDPGPIVGGQESFCGLTPDHHGQHVATVEAEPGSFVEFDDTPIDGTYRFSWSDVEGTGMSDAAAVDAVADALHADSNCTSYIYGVPREKPGHRCVDCLDTARLVVGAVRPIIVEQIASAVENAISPVAIGAEEWAQAADFIRHATDSEARR